MAVKNSVPEVQTPPKAFNGVGCLHEVQWGLLPRGGCVMAWLLVFLLRLHLCQRSAYPQEHEVTASLFSEIDPFTLGAQLK